MNIQRSSTTIKASVIAISLAVIVSFSVLFSIEATAFSQGTYLGSTETYYRNPVTGVIEDQGGEQSIAIGEGMVRSCVHPTALLEVDAEGNHYLTARLHMADSIEGINFMLSDGGEFYQADMTVTQEGNNIIDIRFPITDENTVVRGSMYVAPMGRDVVYFFKASGFVEGRGDFNAEIDTGGVTGESEEAAALTDSARSASEKAESGMKKTVDAKNKKEQKNKDKGKKDTKDKGKKGENDKGSKQEKNDTKNKSSKGVLVYVTGGFAAVLLAAGGTYVYFRRKRGKF
ncbi:heme-binding Shp domain-containing protein [Anaerovoracaceae bacterium SGI.195]